MIKKIIKKISLLIICMLCLVQTAVVSGYADVKGHDTLSEGYALMEVTTGEVITSKNANEKYFPASVTKVMTALLVLENCPNLQEIITFTASGVDVALISSTLTPKAEIGEMMTIEDALHGLMLASGNECAKTLAEHVSGSEAEFVKLMNKKALEIGATNTNFVNAHGLHDENHYTTPYDLGLIFIEALSNEDFVEIASCAQYTIPKTNKYEARNLTMGHRMVNKTISYPGAYAGKTGYTVEAGRTLVTAAKRINKITNQVDHLVAVVMKSDEACFYTDTMLMMEHGFEMLQGESCGVEWVEKEETVYAIENVRMREKPCLYANTVGSLEGKKEATRIATWGKWSKIQSGDKLVYVASAFLTTNPNGLPDGTYVEPTYEPLVYRKETPTEATTIEEVTTKEGENDTTSSAPVTSHKKAKKNDNNALLKTIKLCVVLMIVIAIVFIAFSIYSAKKRRKRRGRYRSKIHYGDGLL